MLDAVQHPKGESLSYEGGRRNVSPPPSTSELLGTDCQEYEKSPLISTFQSQFRALRDRLISLPESSFQNPIMIRRGSEIIESTALREVYAAAFHSIHHFAIMSAILREIMGPENAEKYIPVKFGFKPKTGVRARL